MVEGDEVATALADQTAYYRARAPEYDADMWTHGRAEHELTADLLAEIAAVDTWFDRLPVTGRVLELGCGTGRWTSMLADRAVAVTALDAAPEMLAVTRTRVGAGRAVSLVAADLFGWDTDERFDLVFFSFLLSHIPPQRAEALWDRVERWLRPGGVVAFVDAPPSRVSEEDYLEEGSVPRVRRRLRDGREFTAVKVFRTPEDLVATLTARGWHAEVGVIGERFLCGRAMTRDGSSGTEVSQQII